MIKPEFTCPQTGENCEFAVYCSIKKDMIEGGRGRDDPVGDLLVERLPAEELSELGNIGFCAEKMIKALARTAEPLDGLGSTELTEADLGFLALNDRNNF